MEEIYIPINDDTPVACMTIGQLKQMLANSVREAVGAAHKGPEPVSKKELSQTTPAQVNGIKGLAALLGCSKGTAQKIKSSGDIDEAVTQRGRTIVIDSRLALRLIQKAEDKRKAIKPRKNRNTPNPKNIKL